MEEKVVNRTPEGELYYGVPLDLETGISGAAVKRERDGSLYIGEWSAGLRDGRGAFFEQNGHVCVGMWEQDRLAGPCILICPSDSPFLVFNGSLRDKKLYEGTAFFADGRLYHGIFTEWRDTEFDGEGALRWSDGRIYAGRWKNGGTDSGGVIRRTDGRVTGKLMNGRPGYYARAWGQDAERVFFYGETADDEVRNAVGINFYNNGELYAGGLRGGAKNGPAVFQGADGTIRIGTWKNGNQQGPGVWFRRMGKELELYIGELLNGQFHGSGAHLVYREKAWTLTYCGGWADGKWSGIGLQNTGDGQFFYGQFQNGLRNGPGELILEDGTRTDSGREQETASLKLREVTGPGPERRLYSAGETVPCVVFNSLVQHSKYGAPYGFMGIRPETAQKFKRSVQLEPGLDYEVRIFYRNDADISLPDPERTAEEVRLSVYFSEKVGPGQDGTVSALLQANNADPLTVWDCVRLTAAEELPVIYKIASAKIWNKRKSNGRILPQSLFTEKGALLGGDELNGVLPSGDQYAGYVTLCLHTEGKRRTGQRDASEKRDPPAAGKRKRSGISIRMYALLEDRGRTNHVQAAIGEEFLFGIAFSNNASVQDIQISLSLPDTIEYIPGSTSVIGPDAVAVQSSDAWLQKGLILSSFAADGEGEIRFRARYFPTAAAEPGGARLRAMIETKYVTMSSEMTVTGERDV